MKITQNKKRSTYIFSFLLLITYCLSTISASAASLGFLVSKSLFDAEILPGTTYQDEIVIANTSTDAALPLHLQLSVWDLSDGSEENISFIAVDDEVNPLKWFSLVTSGGKTMKDAATLKPLAAGHDFILGPGEEEALRFRVRPPNDVAAGTYLVSMRFQAAVPEHYYESAAGPRFIPEMATLFFLKVPHFSLDGVQTNYAAEILDIGLKDENQPVTGVIQVAKADVLDDAAKIIATKIKNTGAFYFKANGIMRISSWTGKVVKDIPLPPKYMLPGKVRTLEIPLSADAGSGILKKVGKYIADNSYFGKYTATIILNYPAVEEGTGFTAGNFAEKSIQFWVFPWRFMLIVAGVVGLFTIFIKRFGGRIAKAFRIIFSLGKKQG
jgi:hypothetical protein